MQNLKDKTLKELEEFFLSIKEPKFRSKQAFHRIHKLGSNSIDQFTEFSLALREKLRDALPSLELLRIEKDSKGTEKAVFYAGKTKTGEDKVIESVWISADDRDTICISTQAGCSLHCTFCATGTLPFRGNLRTDQILDQVYIFMKHRNKRPDNIVFMGMGEPFMNYEASIKAAQILSSPDGLNISARHITLSTAGVIQGIKKFTDDREPFNLAISLNHPNSIKRSKLMDVDKANPLNDLLSAARIYTVYSGKPVTFEYVLIPGENMSSDDADRLISIARSLNCKINLIPLHTEFNGLKRPQTKDIEAFQKKLHDAGILVFLRSSAGLEINGACGMLALKESSATSTKD